MSNEASFKSRINIFKKVILGISLSMSINYELPEFHRGDSVFKSATFNSQHHPTYTGHFETLVYFLAVLQHFQVNIIPITWQSGLEDLGRGISAVVHQSMIHANLDFAFKRTGDNATYATLISEVAILSLPQIREHPNINGLHGICWEIRENGSDTVPSVWPVLVYTKADFGDIQKFLKSEVSMNLTLKQRLDLCLDIGRGVHTLHKWSMSPIFSRERLVSK